MSEAPPQGAPYTMSIHPQSESYFFRLPIELRHCIYAHFINKPGYHIVHTSKEITRLSPCLGPDLFGGQVGWERHMHKDTIKPCPEYNRRLMSTWGPHWMCEELLLRGKLPVVTNTATYGDTLSSLEPALTICKRIYLEVLGLMTTKTDFHITDLKSLEVLLGISPPEYPIDRSFPGIETIIHPLIGTLCITLSQPLAFFRTLETPISVADRPSPSDSNHDVSAWYSFPSRVQARFPQLVNLHLWLDHTGEEYWSVVNERAVLAPMLDAVRECPQVNLLVVLPMVHPRIESNQRHFLKDTIELDGPGDSVVGGSIRRTVRQRERVRCFNTPNAHIFWIEDFPHSLHGFSFTDMTQCETEEWEAGLWRQGMDISDLWRYNGSGFGR